MPSGKVFNMVFIAGAGRNEEWKLDFYRRVSGCWNVFQTFLKQKTRLCVIGYEQQKLVIKVKFWIFLAVIGKKVVILQPEKK